ncbi:MAG: type II secretion system protein [Synechococcus sp.]|nr:type II secretion system protein [Synechococcus sp.]
MAVKIKRQGFTIVELLFTIVIVSILTGAGIMGYRQQTKKAFATEVETQLSAASKKLITTALGLQKITESNCLKSAELHNSNNFTYSCTERNDGSNIFDIAVKPVNEIGVGGILSFGIGKDNICWDTCDATGSGKDAQLSKSHLDLSNNCSALTRQVRDYDCNCTNTPVNNCKRVCSKTFYYCCFGNPTRCSNRCIKQKCRQECTTQIVSSCATCTDVTYQ